MIVNMKYDVIIIGAGPGGIFSAYELMKKRQSILQAIAEQSRIVRLPLNQVGSLNKVNQEIKIGRASCRERV